MNITFSYTRSQNFFNDLVVSVDGEEKYIVETDYRRAFRFLTVKTLDGIEVDYIKVQEEDSNPKITKRWVVKWNNKLAKICVDPKTLWECPECYRVKSGKDIFKLTTNSRTTGRCPVCMVAMRVLKYDRSKDEHLKPCPFCGAPGKIFEDLENERLEVACSAYGPDNPCPAVGYGWDIFEREEAIKNWNRRYHK